jgi:hypothetical protein
MEIAEYQVIVQVHPHSQLILQDVILGEVEALKTA